ncbi:MAG TPA: polyprenyl diphosphate synthase [Steroidobacteraceae bacterium]
MSATPRHVAIIMDGNGRWAAGRGLPRQAGHKAGIAPVRMVIEECSRRGVAALTLFAFSSENWGRPSIEVSGIMNLFLDALERETQQLHANGVRVRLVGDRGTLPVRLQARLALAEDQTANNSGLRLQLAVSYGGRWDIVQANQKLAQQCLVGALNPRDISEARVAAALELSDVPDPDLFIRTGGERRISNFLLWNLAYTELYFSDGLWPDFAVADFEAALSFFAQRQRRFGLTPAARAPEAIK